jgi:signal peptidase II
MPKTASSGSLGPWLGLAAIVILLDQISKALIRRSLAYGATVAITPWFDIVHAHNLGAAFSFLDHPYGWQRWLFTGLGIAAAIFIVWMLRRHGQQTLFALALSLIMGGALGNVIDRLWHGYVIDFIQVHWHRAWYFPAFNLADSAITLGAAFLILDELRRVQRGR